MTRAGFTRIYRSFDSIGWVDRAVREAEVTGVRAGPWLGPGLPNNEVITLTNVM